MQWTPKDSEGTALLESENAFAFVRTLQGQNGPAQVYVDPCLVPSNETVQ